MPTKGITPIISIIILLLITVALAGAAWSFIQGIFFPQVSKAFIISPGAAFCTAGIISVFVLNTGYQTDILTPNDWIVAEVGGVQIGETCSADPNDVACGLTTNTIPTGEAKKVVRWDCDEGGSTALCSGTLRVSL